MLLLAASILIALPWLNPFSPGPTAAVVPLLFAWSCAAGLLLLRASTHPNRQRADWVRAMAGAWVVAAAVSAVIGLLQYFGASAWLGVVGQPHRRSAWPMATCASATSLPA